MMSELKMEVEISVSTINRVVVNERGEAKSPAMAAFDHDIIPEIVFIRNDGWALGAPKRFAAVAFEMWRKEWTHFAKAPDWDTKRILEYYQ